MAEVKHAEQAERILALALDFVEAFLQGQAHIKVVTTGEAAPTHSLGLEWEPSDRGAD